LLVAGCWLLVAGCWLLVASSGTGNCLYERTGSNLYFFQRKT